jgi:hypothetical protein
LSNKRLQQTGSGLSDGEIRQACHLNTAVLMIYRFVPLRNLKNSSLIYSAESSVFATEKY